MNGLSVVIFLESIVILCYCFAADVEIVQSTLPDV